MILERLVLGIDTSCYTTSIAIVDGCGNIAYEAKKMLEVKKGSRGLRQSDAFFQHAINLPEMFEQIPDTMINGISEVWVSTKPRNVADSYMPVFTAGFKFAKVISKCLGVPLYETSHQEGHIRAVCMGLNMDYKGSYLAVHLSGGTTEILSFGFDDEQNRADIEIVAKTLDISAGQLLDRVGVAGGFEFPAGKYLDEICEKSRLKFPVSLKGNDFNFSGAESWGMRYLNDGVDMKYIADGLFNAIACTLYGSLSNIAGDTGVYDVLMTGGVASSVSLRNKLVAMSSESELRFHFAGAGYCADNARGVAGMGIL